MKVLVGKNPTLLGHLPKNGRVSFEEFLQVKKKTKKKHRVTNTLLSRVFALIFDTQGNTGYCEIFHRLRVQQHPLYSKKINFIDI